jgi:surfeit locus 1 family protein
VKPIYRNVLLGVAVMLLAALFVRLGVWQLHRLGERRARNAAWSTALARPPLSLDSAGLAELSRRPTAYLNRRVRLRGTYQPSGEVLLRGRTMEGRPGVYVVTPLAAAGSGWSVMVNRGWTYAPDGASPSVLPPAEDGTVEVEGVLQEIPVAGDRGLPSVSRSGARPVATLRHLDLATLRATSPRPLLPVYVQQLPAKGSQAAGELRRVPLPELDEGPHLGYAIQWFSFAAIALGGYLVLLRRGRQPPRPR